MIKFLNILQGVITERTRYQFQPEIRKKLESLVDKLWEDRDKKYNKITIVDVLTFKMADGTDAMVQVRVIQD